MSALRPLPPRPSLEFERKEAKALLRLLRAGDPDALARARARHPAIDASAPEHIRLADAQLVIAREYGFTSWPRLVRYFGDVERQRNNHRRSTSGCSTRLLREKRPLMLAGPSRARAVRVARTRRVRAAVLRDARGRSLRRRHHRRRGAPRGRAHAAASRAGMTSSNEPRRNRDVSSTGRLTPCGSPARPWNRRPGRAEARGRGAPGSAPSHRSTKRPSGETCSTSPWAGNARQASAAMQPIMDWLAAQGLDRQRELNVRLCGHIRMKTEEVRALLDQGADPDWVAPNGITVLEHAILRYWNGEAVDLVAARATPRKALWIAAGLGDVDGVRRFLDAHGKPTAAARKLPPGFRRRLRRHAAATSGS